MSPLLVVCLLYLGANWPPASADRASEIQFLKNYDPDLPMENGEPVKVSLGLYLNSLRLQESDSTMRTHFYMRKSWKDEDLLPLFDSHPAKVDKLLLGAELRRHIWLPDVYFRNAISVQSFNVPVDQNMMRLNKTGHVWWVQSLRVIMSCYDMDRWISTGQDFVCPMYFESYALTSDRMFMDWMTNPIEIDKNINIPRYTVQEIGRENCSQTYTTGSFPCLELRFKFSHSEVQISRFGPYLTAFLLVILSWLGFWIDGEQVTQRLGFGLIIAIILTIQTFCGKIFIDNVYILAKFETYTTSCTVLVMATLMEYALAYGVFTLIPRKLAGARKAEDTEDTQPRPRSRIAFVMDVACGLIIFPVIFALYNIIFWSMHKSA